MLTQYEWARARIKAARERFVEVWSGPLVRPHALNSIDVLWVLADVISCNIVREWYGDSDRVIG